MNPFRKRGRKRGRQQGCPHLWTTSYLPSKIERGDMQSALEIRHCQRCPVVKTRTVFVHA